MRKTIDQILDDAAVRLGRLSPLEAWAEMRAGATLVDTRSPDQRQAQGYVPGSVHHPLSTIFNMWAERKVRAMSTNGSISAKAPASGQFQTRQITTMAIIAVTTIVPATAIP